MDDIKPSNSSSTDVDSFSPRPAGGQVMDIKSGSPNDSAPTLPEPTAAEAETATTSNDSIAEAPAVENEPDLDAKEATSSTAGSTSPREEVSGSPETPPESPQEAPAEAAASPVADAASSASSLSTGPASDTPSADSSEHSLLAIPPMAPKKSGKPILVIAIAVIVAIGLAGLVVFTFLKTKKDTVGSGKTVNSATTQPVAKPLASPADVDTTNKEIETSLNKVNDSTDFSSTALSDKSLGL